MLVTLKNEKITMVVSTLGAEPQSLVFEGREYLWNGDKEYWFRRAPLLFPMIGPTKDDKIGYQGKEYKMPNNGFARDTEFSLGSQNDREAVFILEDSQETRENNYPFGFILKVTYSLLENGYKAKAEITAKDDLYYTFGWHPAFSLDINGKGADLETYTLSFEEEEKADRKYAKDGIFEYEKDFLVGDQIELTRREMDKGPIILDDIKSSEVTLTSSLGEHGVTVTMGKMKTFTAWTTLNKWAQFLCLEPMLSFGDTKREFDIDKMKETRLLEKGKTETYENEFIVF